MCLPSFPRLSISLFAILFVYLIISPDYPLRASAPLQGPILSIKERNPVVNEGNQITLTALDANGQPVAGVSWESGSPDIAAVDPVTGLVRGIKRGFATITARSGFGSSSVFVAVMRVSSSKGPKVPGDAKSDTSGRFYISDPAGSVILRKDSVASPAIVYAGLKGINGKRDGVLADALFAGPTAVAIDNSTLGGIYVADTLNHSIRKIDQKERVSTLLGTGAPGTKTDSVTLFEQVQLNGPRGLAPDTGGNLFIADTDNHAIYYADFTERKMHLLAGQPGVSGMADGKERAALFKRPVGIAVSNDGRSIAVADTGNNAVRLITRDGVVSTIKKSSSSNFTDLQTDDFDAPQSVNFDGVGNIYVVDRSGVFVVTDPLGSRQNVVPLAQTGTFGQAASVVVNGTDVVVLDTNAQSEDDAVKTVSIGAPEILSLTETSGLIQPATPLEGKTKITLNGKNFAPESKVILGDSEIVDASVVSATEISFTVPSQNAPGIRTLSVQTRGGVAQRAFPITSKQLSQLAIGEITTLAGGVPFLGDGGSASGAALNLFLSGSITVDAIGNLFIADSRNHRVRRVDIDSGVITTVAGSGIKGFSGDGGQGLSASLNEPTAVAVDQAGNIFIADAVENNIRKVDANTGIITTVAGKGAAEPVLQFNLSSPGGLAIVGTGNLFIADTGNNRILNIDIDRRLVSTVAGVSLKSPRCVTIDNSGNLFIADTENHLIRRVDTNGIITTVAGNGGNIFGGDGGPATGASLFSPSGVAVDKDGNLFIADTGNNRIRKVDGTGIITTISDSVSLNNPQSVAVDGSGNLFIADNRNRRIRRFDSRTNLISTIAGTDIALGDNDPAIIARLGNPAGLAIDRAGNIFIVDQESNRIRRVDAETKNITTVAGNGKTGFSGDGGIATDASFNSPQAIAVDQDGNLFIADTENNRIRKVNTTTTVITTIAGNATRGFGGDGGKAINANLNNPTGVAVDGEGNLFIADRLNNRIRKVDRNDIITTVAGDGTNRFSGDGGPAPIASLNFPSGIAADQEGNLFIADSFNNRIRRIDKKTGIIATLAGKDKGFSGDNSQAITASLDTPLSVAVDDKGNLFISDSQNERVRRVSGGIITTAAGDSQKGYSGDNGLAARARLNTPLGLAVDKEGNLLIADSANNSVRAIKGIGGGGATGVSITGASFNKPQLTISGSGFGQSAIKVDINGRDVSPTVIDQSDTKITLKGNKKKLNLKKVENQITVTVGGTTSNTFVFNL